MNHQAKIYVAGHRGLVGSAIVRKLHKEGYSNLVTRKSSELDLRNQAQVEHFFKTEKPEYVFLAAARVGGILANSTYKAQFIYDNLAIALNVIHASYTSNVKKLLNLGSSCIYPKHAPQPIKEEHLLTGSLESTNEPYAIAKIAGIKLCRYYNEQYHTNFLSGMPTNLYGPNDNFNLETAHVLPTLIRKFYLAKLLEANNIDQLLEDVNRIPLGFGLDAEKADKGADWVVPVLANLGITGDAVTLWGTGKPFREFLHVDDLANASLHLIRNSSHAEIGELVNIGMGTDLPIAEIGSLVRRLVGFRGGIRFDSSRPDGTPRKLLDISKLTSLGWRPAITLEEGLRQTIKWYISQAHARDHGAN